MKTVLCWCAVAAATALLEGCSSPGSYSGEKGHYADISSAAPPLGLSSATSSLTVTNPLDASLLRPDNRLFTLGPGDALELEILGTPASRAATAVGPDGKIYFYLLPGLDV